MPNPEIADSLAAAEVLFDTSEEPDGMFDGCNNGAVVGSTSASWTNDKEEEAGSTSASWTKDKGVDGMTDSGCPVKEAGKALVVFATETEMLLFVFAVEIPYVEEAGNVRIYLYGPYGQHSAL